MRKLSFIIAFILVTLTVYPQAYYQGKTHYKSTENILFENRYDKATIRIAGKKGEWKFILKREDRVRRGIGNDVYIYLKNDSVIVLEDRINTDYLNKKTSAVYDITSKINKFLKADIWSIRYTVGVNGIEESYTIDTEKNILSKIKKLVNKRTSKK